MKRPAPVEELVEVMCTVRGDRIIGLGPSETGWLEKDITDVVHPCDRDRLLSTHRENNKIFWHKVGRKMKLW